MTDLEVLMALKVQGLAGPARLACALACPESEAKDRLEALSGTGLAEAASIGRVSGARLTPKGTAALSEALAAEGLAGNDDLTDLFGRFESADGRLKRLCTDWQIRRHGSIEQPNDHSDPDYDQAVIDRLTEHHDATTALLRRIAAIAPRFAAYQSRFDACLDRLTGGDRSAFTGVMGESYHQVWFELHEDLLLTLGLPRRE